MSVDGLIFELTVDREGRLAASDAAPSAWRWIHRELRHPLTAEWLEASGIDPVARQALLVEDARPRAVDISDGVVVVLRGVNLNPGAEPDDMISLRMWCDSSRLITMRTPHLKAVQDVHDAIVAGHGPGSPADAVTALATRLMDRIATVVAAIEDEVDGLEEELLATPVATLRTRLGDARRKAIVMRRYLAPQRDALRDLSHDRSALLRDAHRAQFREISDRVSRCVEDLDALRERAAVASEELAARVAEQMNRHMYVLSVIAGLFLPLGFITGLLGVNVGGIPGSEFRGGFVVLCAVLLLLAGISLWIFRRWRLL